MDSNIANKICFIREEELKNTKRTTYQPGRGTILFENPDIEAYLKKGLGINRKDLEVASVLAAHLGYSNQMKEKLKNLKNSMNQSIFSIPDTTSTIEFSEDLEPIVYESKEDIKFAYSALPSTTPIERLRKERALAVKLLKATYTVGINEISRSVIEHPAKKESNVELHYYIRRKYPYFLPPVIPQIDDSNVFRNAYLQASLDSNPRIDIWSMNISFWISNYPMEELELRVNDFFTNIPVHQHTKENFIQYMANCQQLPEYEIYSQKVAYKELRYLR